ncbi:MAG: hypothetical protein WA303_06105 [Bradyrhizobium sp.]|jgi:hypothetical protein
MSAARTARFRLPAALGVSGCGVAPVATIQQRVDPGSMSYGRRSDGGHAPIVVFTGKRRL